MSHYHAVVWIDHQRATVWQFTSTEQTNTVIHAQDQHQRVHSRKSTHGGHKSSADHHFFDEVAHALEGVHEILVIGPAQTKQEFGFINHARHLAAHADRLAGFHLHDVKFPARDHRVPFSGMIDFAALVPALPAEHPMVWELSSSASKDDIVSALKHWKQRFAEFQVTGPTTPVTSD